MHTIDQSSPLWGLSPDDFVTFQCRFLVLISGIFKLELDFVVMSDHSPFSFCAPPLLLVWCWDLVHSVFAGIDATFSDTVHKEHTYTVNDVLIGERAASILRYADAYYRS